MTWIVGAITFNGVVAVADVQATFAYLDKSRKPLYFNCVKKLHRVHQNLYVGFSGDIRSGLLLIETLTGWIASCIQPDHLFDIEGQLSILQNFLRNAYKDINPNENPELRLIFYWLKQEGDNVIFEPACMRFNAPNFGMNGISSSEINQAGSGMASPDFQVLVEFITGKTSENALREKIFGEVSVVPDIWTVKKLRNLLVREGGNVDYPGVSKTFLSVTAEIGWDKVASAAATDRVMKAMTGHGIDRWDEMTRSDTLKIIEFDPTKLIKTMQDYATAPEKAIEIASALAAFKDEQDLLPLCTLPEFVEELHPGGGENVELTMLCSTWDDMKRFMREKKINIGTCSATA